MNKKRIGALLIGATLLVGSLGSFAYFTGTTSEIKGNGENNKLQKLNITNGKVEVSSEVTNNGTGNLDWSYDVVKYSLEELTVRNEEFINANRTPDIEGPQKSNVNGIQRVEIGAALPTKINYTRPGDAIVLGVPQGDGTTGLVVTNKSNLTVKMQLVVKTDDKAQAMIQAMNDAGWVMYINGEETSGYTETDFEAYRKTYIGCRSVLFARFVACRNRRRKRRFATECVRRACGNPQKTRFLRRKS